MRSVCGRRPTEEVLLSALVLEGLADVDVGLGCVVELAVETEVGGVEDVDDVVALVEEEHLLAHRADLGELVVGDADARDLVEVRVQLDQVAAVQDLLAVLGGVVVQVVDLLDALGGPYLLEACALGVLPLVDELHVVEHQRECSDNTDPEEHGSLLVAEFADLCALVEQRAAVQLVDQTLCHHDDSQHCVGDEHVQQHVVEFVCNHTHRDDAEADLQPLRLGALVGQVGFGLQPHGRPVLHAVNAVLVATALNELVLLLRHFLRHDVEFSGFLAHCVLPEGLSQSVERLHGVLLLEGFIVLKGVAHGHVVFVRDLHFVFVQLDVQVAQLLVVPKRQVDLALALELFLVVVCREDISFIAEWLNLVGLEDAGCSDLLAIVGLVCEVLGVQPLGLLLPVCHFDVHDGVEEVDRFGFPNDFLELLDGLEGFVDLLDFEVLVQTDRHVLCSEFHAFEHGSTLGGLLVFFYDFHDFRLVFEVFEVVEFLGLVVEVAALIEGEAIQQDFVFGCGVVVALADGDVGVGALAELRLLEVEVVVVEVDLGVLRLRVRVGDVEVEGPQPLLDALDGHLGAHLTHFVALGRDEVE
eukprot:CAMPEP_0116963490 /NCGR_PEP_ID=MMETSP0467-20121206/47949_1 /TAXON_ID=283647 /ORGANISM="Mesodinium pulex, Strain SPMC105" /LENGTH=584 /DNA_ID=CAMNT_0004652143 /DNA_START=403 /DNA_END=2158 /DNA_ORIENTATION=+